MADDYVDTWKIEYGPDDHEILVTKNGELVARLSAPRDGRGEDYERFKKALAWVEDQATYGDELVIHYSGSL